MTTPRLAASVILSLDTCEPSGASEYGRLTHLVGPVADGSKRYCDGKTMRDPVLADSDRPTCARCRDGFDYAVGLRDAGMARATLLTLVALALSLLFWIGYIAGGAA